MHFPRLSPGGLPAALRCLENVCLRLLPKVDPVSSVLPGISIPQPIPKGVFLHHAKALYLGERFADPGCQVRHFHLLTGVKVPTGATQMDLAFGAGCQHRAGSRLAGLAQLFPLDRLGATAAVDPRCGAATHGPQAIVLHFR